MLVRMVAYEGMATTSGGERCLAEYHGGNGAESIDERFAGHRTQGALVEKDEGAGDDEGDGDNGCPFGRVIVAERQHRDLPKRGLSWRRARKPGV